MDSNIRNKSKDKNISPVAVLVLLTQVQQRLRDRMDYSSTVIYEAIRLRTVPPATVIKTIQDVSMDNPLAMIDAIGEDLFNDINDIDDIPDYTWSELHKK